MATKQYIMARALLMELIGERPQDGQLRHQLGKVYFELERPGSRDRTFSAGHRPQSARCREPQLDRRHQAAEGEIEAAKAAYAEAAQIQPLIRRPAAKLPADFRVLALYAPVRRQHADRISLQGRRHDTDTLALFAAREYDVEPVRQNVQVVVNLISDADQADSLLPLAADLADRLGKPTVNHPRKIQSTTRDAVAALLAGIPGCSIPKVLRLNGRR